MNSAESKDAGTTIRDEEYATPGSRSPEASSTGDSSLDSLTPWKKRLAKLTQIERKGAQPVPVEDRTNRNTFELFTLWFTLSTNLLPVVTGMVGTLSYGLSLRDSSLIILFFSILCTIPVGYLATLGPKTGMRQMIQARFSFGYYFVSIPILLNMATLTGFCVIDSVVGGLTLSSVSQDGLSPTVGIVIVDIISLLVTFCGLKVLHYYERFAWIPALIAIVVATGCGGRHLSNQTTPQTSDAATVLTFGALIAGYLVPWAALASDFATYMDPRTPSYRIFLYTYGGIFLPTVLLMILGAAIGGAVPSVPSWQAGYEANSVGGVFAAMLEPAGGFGKFLVVILSLSIIGNIAATMYSITLNFQLLIPWLIRIPRALFSIVITAVVIPVSIRAAVSFFDNLENFIGVIGYWAAAFVAVVGTEHILFRKSDFKTYQHEIWDHSKALPTGVAAIVAAVLCFALVIPCMAQVWYTGPIATVTGDIGFEMAFAVTTLLYMPFRALERKWQGCK